MTEAKDGKLVRIPQPVIDRVKEELRIFYIHYGYHKNSEVAISESLLDEFFKSDEDTMTGRLVCLLINYAEDIEYGGKLESVIDKYFEEQGAKH